MRADELKCPVFYPTDADLKLGWEAYIRKIGESFISFPPPCTACLSRATLGHCAAQDSHLRFPSVDAQRGSSKSRGLVGSSHRGAGFRVRITTRT